MPDPNEVRKHTAFDHDFTRIDRKPGFLTGEAGDSIKPGAERSGTPGTRRIEMTEPAGRATVLGSCAMTDSLDPPTLTRVPVAPLRGLANLLRHVPRADALGFTLSSTSRTTYAVARYAADPAATAPNSDTPPSYA